MSGSAGVRISHGTGLNIIHFSHPSKLGRSVPKIHCLVPPVFHNYNLDDFVKKNEIIKNIQLNNVD